MSVNVSSPGRNPPPLRTPVFDAAEDLSRFCIPHNGTTSKHHKSETLRGLAWCRCPLAKNLLVPSVQRWPAPFVLSPLAARCLQDQVIYQGLRIMIGVA